MASSLLSESLIQHISTETPAWFRYDLDFQPNLQMKAEQWPEYDPIVYKSIVWDKEYYLDASATIALTIEFANEAYYKLSGTFTLAKIGLGIQSILFEQYPTQFCNLYYYDSRFLESSLVLESNAKSCGYNLIADMGLHFDNYSEVGVEEK